MISPSFIMKWAWYGAHNLGRKWSPYRKRRRKPRSECKRKVCRLPAKTTGYNAGFCSRKCKRNATQKVRLAYRPLEPGAWETERAKKFLAHLPNNLRRTCAKMRKSEPVTLSKMTALCDFVYARCDVPEALGRGHSEGCLAIRAEA